MSKKIRSLILGAGGQIGPLLASALAEKNGYENVILSDIRQIASEDFPFVLLDVCDRKALEFVIKSYNIQEVYHLAAILSARGEKDPLGTWNVNMSGLLNVLDVCKELKVDKVFYPSSIAAFGMNLDLSKVGQHANLTPTTVYGISKSSGELWANYYYLKYGLDVRSLRYPGLISYQTPPGGGTTDYAVEIFHEAKNKGFYTCFLEKDRTLPMMYMEDAIAATVSLMEAPADLIRVRTSYNLSAFSFNPDDLASEIKKYIPNFKIDYAPDFRNEIAKGWPQYIDDSEAREDWNWQERIDFSSMVKIMIENI
jgi:nucleoside-diphosphate-sugar epimerase